MPAMRASDGGPARGRSSSAQRAGAADQSDRAVRLLAPDVEQRALARALGHRLADATLDGEDVRHPDDVDQTDVELAAVLPARAEVRGERVGQEADRHHSLHDDVWK